MSESNSDPMVISGDYPESRVEFVDVNAAISDASFNELYLDSDIATLTNVTAATISQVNSTTTLDGIVAGTMSQVSSTTTLDGVVAGTMSISGGSAAAQGLVTVSDSFSASNTTLTGGFRSQGNWKIPGIDDRLVVDGFTYAMNGDESWDQVFIRNGGVITHTIDAQTAAGADGVELTANHMEIDTSSSINLDSKGNQPTDDVGDNSSGSYGGSAGTSGSRTTNATYGDYKAPQHFGTGGRYHSAPNDRNTYRRGSGGGSIKLNISGELLLDGIISADGEPGADGSSPAYGGGSGGSIWLDVGTLTTSYSSVRIRAIGGYGLDGAGGGRIAIYYDNGNLNPAVHISAEGGSRYYDRTFTRNGQPGSVYVENKQTGWSLLRFDNKEVNKSNSDPMVISGDYPESKVEFVNVNVAISDASFNQLYLDSDIATLTNVTAATISQVSGTTTLTNVTAATISQVSSTATLNGVVAGTMRISGGSAAAQGLVTVSDSFSTSNTTLTGGIKSQGNWKIPGIDDHLVVDGFTYAMNGDESWDQVFIRNGGVITHTIDAQTATGADGVELTANYMEIDASSSINLDSKGNLPTDDVGIDSSGSYGGSAGTSESRTTNATYGDYKVPQFFGTGGRYYDGSRNRRGGGSIKLNISGELLLDGSISANGGYYLASNGGSGGSIWLDVGTLTTSQSSARIKAIGGDGSDGAGGGRIAIYYENGNLNPEVHTSAAGGSHYYRDTYTRNGQPGSVYVENKQTGWSLLRFDNKGVDKSYSDPMVISGEYSADEVAFANVIVELEDSSFKTVSLANTTAHLMGEVQIGTAVRGSSSTLHSNGQLVMPNNDLVIDGFTYELQQNETWNKVSIVNGGVLTHSGALVELPDAKGVTLKASELFVDASARIDVSDRGYGPNEEVDGFSGGSYGGRGGIVGSGTNAIFGSELQPDDFGIGGGSSFLSIRGGGAIQLVTEDLFLYGSILANGQESGHGAGSGGSIWIDTSTLTAGESALVAANGGYGGSHGSGGGGGGGGRIAIYYDLLDGLETSQLEVKGGSAYKSFERGQDGTIHLAERVSAPRVKSLNVESYTNETLSSIAVQFNIVIDMESIDTSDFELLDEVGNSFVISDVSTEDYAQFTVSFTQPLSEGTYTFSVGPDIFATNGLGMDQDQDGIELEPEDDRFTFTFVVDTTRPIAPSIDQPVAPAVNSSNSRDVTLSGEREDNTAIWVNGSEFIANGNGNWSGAYRLPEGESSLAITAVDLSGNVSESATVNFNIDSIAPDIISAYPTGSNNVVPLVAALVVVEDGTGIDLENSSVEVKRNGISLAGSVALFEGQIQFTPDAPFLDGDYQIIARIADQLGNLSTQRIYNFVLDYTPPAPAALGDYPSVTTVNAQVFNGTREAGSAVLVNGSLAVAPSAETTWSTQVALLQGDNTISFVVRDAAGNESEPTLAQIHYDDNPPGPVALSIDANGSGTELLLDWSSYDEFANGNDIGEYRIYQSANAFADIAGKSPLAVVEQGTKQFRVEGLPRDTQAHFAVVAFDTQGLFNPSVTSVESVPMDVEAPDEIANLVVQSGADSLQLSWNPSANTAGDLVGYKVAFIEDPSGRVDDIPLASLGDPQGVVQHLVTGLSPATSYPVRVYAYDESGNASTGITDAGTTLLPNPATVTATPKSSKIEISWSSVAPYELLKNYAVYVQESSFSSTAGLQPKAVRSKGSVSDTELNWSLAGLKNGTTYYVAVASVNISGGSDPAVTPVAVTPEADTEGPTIEAAEYQQGTALLDLTTTPQLVQDGRFKIAATDESGVARVEFYLDGKLLGTEYAASGGDSSTYGRNVALLNYTDGDHALTVKAYDVWENVTIAEYGFSVALAAPSAPQITSPSEGWLTNNPAVTVYGSAEKQTQVQLYRNGTAVGTVEPVDSTGKFQVEITLEEGDNLITAAAEYPGRSGFGAQSAARTVTLNTSIPDAPTDLTAIERELGEISLSWSAVSSDDAENQTAGYNVYRSTSPFATAQEAQKVNSQLLSEGKFTDLPSVDGDYFYAVTTVNEVPTESSLSSLVEATADSEGPHALEVSYQSSGLVDSASGRHAPGTVEVTVQFDEPLRNKPYFALAPEGGVPLTVDLSKDYSDDTLYSGSFTIEPGMLSGTAYAVMSAHDHVGNRGTIIEAGNTLLIDAKGPEVIALTLNPGEPLQVDEQNGLPVEVVLQLDDEVKPGEMPSLIPLIDNMEIAGYENGIGLTRDAQSIEGQPLWVGSFVLPVTAGQDDAGNPAVESLRFSYRALDDLDNESTRVRAPNNFQVYQGELPPLDIPQNLKAIAQPNGGVALEWDPVEEARYVLYRKAEGDAEYTELKRLPETETTDSLPSDGQYFYAVASERRDNDQIAVSAMSEPVAVSADSIAPAIPTELALELNGAGIVATWAAPTTDAQGNAEEVAKLSYNLYRLNLAEGESADSALLQSIEPLQTGIPDTIALDAKPSESEHAYVITALDAAGNESAPSETAYLNFGLLPVSDISISVNANGNPQLQWNHSGAAIAGYRVYVGGDEDLQEITSALIPHGGNPTTFVDESYTAGAQGAIAERRYTVIAEDDQGATSIGHSLLLPALSVEVIEPEDGDTAIKRGVMNEVRFRVQNRGSGDISGVKLFATVSDNGVAREHQSASFSVAAGGLVEVPIVIGGYGKLDTLSNIQLRLEQSPLPGEAVFIHAEDEVLVGDAALRLGLETDTVYRGGLGKVRFTMENTSAVETEVLVARSNGGNPSDEVRIRIEDADGNLLSTQTVRQFTGDVITVASGETVARLQPGETFVSDWIQVPIPQAAPDQVTVALEIDHFRYHTGKPTQVVIEGNGTRIQASLQETAYTGELTTITPEQVYSAGETVTFSGRALDRASASPVGNVPLTLVLEVRGFERQVSVITDSDGNFSHVFDPQGQSGTWRVSVIHPDSLGRPNQGEFAVLTSEVSPRQVNINILRNYNQTVPISVKAGHGSALSNVRLVSVAEPGTEQLQIPTGLHLDPGSVIELAPQQKGVINLTLSGNNLAPESGFLYFQVLADVNGVAQVLEDIALEYRLSESRPVIKAAPSFIDTGVALGGSTTETFALKNTGFDVLRNATLTLEDGEQNPAPAWVRLGGTASLGDMDIGASRDIRVTFSPDASVEQGNYEFRLVVEGDGGHRFTVPIFVAAVTSEQGDAFFHISDIYTATLSEDNQLIPGLAGAKIELQNEQVLSETRTISSDANGEALLKDLPAGRYAYRVSAFDHESVSGRLWVKPGATIAEEVFLMNQIVTVEWQVNEINLEDRYEIKLEATFETQVPVAVVMLDPLSVTLPDMKKGDVFTGELSLTNYGLIRADEVSGALPSGNDVVSFEFLAEVPETIDAGEVVYIPYRITALRDFNPNEEGGASGAGCGRHSYQYNVSYQSQCANGQTVPGGTSTHWSTASRGSCGSSGSGGGGGDSYYYGGGGGSGSGYNPNYTSVGGDVETLRCEPPPCVDGNCKSNKDNTGAQ
ncbi:fibronectin type III domain-containing protein [Microbulbifer sp.]|uniref:fibronectin type III domain-containing protein n=1 Tax=Microbulbifer sp. TaxID=1908541 RepID=UPI003F3D0554